MTLPRPRGNPLATQWRLPSFHLPHCDVPYTYSQTYTVPGSTTVTNQVLHISKDADFYVRRLEFEAGNGLIVGTTTIRLKNANGDVLCKDMLLLEDHQGVVWPPLYCPAGSSVFLDITNGDVASQAVQVMLRGSKRYKRSPILPEDFDFEPSQYVPLRRMYSEAPAGWHDEPFDYVYEPAALAANGQVQIQCIMDSDAVFYWRGLIGRTQSATDNNLKPEFEFTDPYGQQLSSTFVVPFAILGGLSVNGWFVKGFSKPLYPEVPCPPDSIVTADLREYVGGGVPGVGFMFILRGVKRFRGDS